VPDTTHASDDERFAEVDLTMKRHQFQADALIEVLHKAQELFGYLRADVLVHVARGLKLPPSRVHGVATFYHLFHLKPPAAHACIICLGTACFIKGADRLLRAAEGSAGIPRGETTGNRQLSLDTVRCIGTCGIAPVVLYDDVPVGCQAADDVRRRLKEWLPHGP
jgi:bidirectional [NiFe] hydrogenase diaphorase subunit